jgi:Na+/melibiose symporter-like transporter
VVELKTGERADGLLLGLREFFNKILLGFMILAFQLAMQFSGFEKGEPLTTASTLVIKISLLVPLLLLYLAFWANGRIGITKAQLVEISNALVLKRNLEDFHDLQEIKS